MIARTSWLDRPIEKLSGYRSPSPVPSRRQQAKAKKAAKAAAEQAALSPSPPPPPPPSLPQVVPLRQRKAAAKDIIKWIEEKCHVAEGRLLGQPFKLDQWQKDEIIRIYDNRHGTRRAILSVGRKNGKGLAVDTLIATPRGWSTMGDLCEGDQVFDERGQVCKVTYKSPVHIGLRCWRLTFADGTSIVADEQHRWLTTHKFRPWEGDYDRLGRRLRGDGHGRKPVTNIVTTPQIARSAHLRRNDGVIEHNHKLPVAGAIECPEIDLPISPYVLGYWLGNGDTRGAVLTTGNQDAVAICKEIEQELMFEMVPLRVYGNMAPRFSMTRGRGDPNSIQSRLRTLGVLGNKHIPDIYLWASREQRLALLQGLMDSDGTASSKPVPRCYFEVMNRTLAEGTLQLVRSLGFKAAITEGVARLNGRPVGTVWSVAFTAYQEDEVFRLERKRSRLRSRPAKPTRASSNAVVACDEVPSVPTVCIQVDSPSSLFLAGEGMTPTHNTGLASVLLLVHLIGPKARPNSQMYSTAQSREQASLIFHMAAKIVRMSPALRDSIVIKEAAKELHCRELGTKYRALSAEASTAYGLSPVFVVHDELGQIRGPRSPLYEALETATGAQDDPLSVIISTQAPTDGDLLSVLIEDALAGYDPRVVCRLYTAPVTMDPFAIETIKLANPAFGTFLNPTEVEAMAADARRMPSREAEFRNLILNQRVEACQQFLQPAQWMACGHRILGDLTKVREVYGGLDLSEAADLTALVLIGKIDGVWHARSWFWMPDEGIFDRSRTDHVPYDQWKAQGYLETVPGAAITYDRIAERVCQILAEHKGLQKIAFDRWNFNQLKPWLTHFGWTNARIESRWIEFGQGTQSMSPALRELESRVLRRELAHGNNPILNMCAANAVIEGNRDGQLKKDSSARRLSKKRSTGRIDGMVALAMAMGIAPMGAPVDISALIA